MYLRVACEPIRIWLENPDVVEIMCNRPCEVWVEDIRHAEMTRHDVPELTRVLIERIAGQVAGHTSQSVNETTPLLSAAMPGGERFQGVLHPASPDGGSFSIRKQVISNLTLAEYAGRGAFDKVRITGPKLVDPDDVSETDAELVKLLRDTSPQGIRNALEFAVQNQMTMIVSGGTSSGKTTLLNALMRSVPENERILTIEDTRELKPVQPNVQAMIASKGGQGLSTATIQNCLEAALRLRPDRIFLGEIRGAEAWSFLQAVNTGHPGSMSSLHANTPREAIERLALATMQAGFGMTKSEITEYIRLVVPVIIQIRRKPDRSVTEIYFNKYTRPE